MPLVDEFRKSLDTIMHPDKKITNGMSMSQAIKSYLIFSIIPFVALVVLEFILGLLIHSYGMVFTYGLGFSAIGIAYMLGQAILHVWVEGVVLLVVAAFLYQFFGNNIFHRFKSNLGASATAQMYGQFPYAAIVWVFVIPGLGLIIEILAVLYGIYVATIGLSNLQKTSRLEAFGVIVASGIAIFVILFIIALFYFGATYPYLLNITNTTSTTSNVITSTA